MKIIVGIKRVVDHHIKVRVNANNTDIDHSQVKMAINPFCEIGVEEAVRLKEKGVASEVISVTVGNELAVEQLYTSFALGADRGFHIYTPQTLTSLQIAKILKFIVDKEQPGLVILGKQSIDSDNNQTGQMLAGLLNWSQGTFVSSIDVSDSSVNVTREVDQGLQVLSLSLPAVITTDLRLNTPRVPSLPNIMKAKQKKIEKINVESIMSDVFSSIKSIEVREPEKRKAGTIVRDVDELIEKLIKDAKVV